MLTDLERAIVKAGSGRKLARAIGVTEGNIVRWKSGKVEPNSTSKIKIKAYLEEGLKSDQ